MRERCDRAARASRAACLCSSASMEVLRASSARWRAAASWNSISACSASMAAFFSSIAALDSMSSNSITLVVRDEAALRWPTSGSWYSRYLGMTLPSMSSVGWLLDRIGSTGFVHAGTSVEDCDGAAVTGSGVPTPTLTQSCGTAVTPRTAGAVVGNGNGSLMVPKLSGESPLAGGVLATPACSAASLRPGSEELTPEVFRVDG